MPARLRANARDNPCRDRTSNGSGIAVPLHRPVRASTGRRPFDEHGRDDLFCVQFLETRNYRGKCMTRVQYVVDQAAPCARQLLARASSQVKPLVALL